MASAGRRWSGADLRGRHRAVPGSGRRPPRSDRRHRSDDRRPHGQPGAGRCCWPTGCARAAGSPGGSPSTIAGLSSLVGLVLTGLLAYAVRDRSGRRHRQPRHDHCRPGGLGRAAAGTGRRPQRLPRAVPPPAAHDSSSAAPTAPPRSSCCVPPAGSTLSWMSTWPDNRYFFSADRALRGGLSGAQQGRHRTRRPDRAADDRDVAIAEFTADAERLGLTPAFFSRPDRRPIERWRRATGSCRSPKTPCWTCRASHSPESRGRTSEPRPTAPPRTTSPSAWSPSPTSPGRWWPSCAGSPSSGSVTRDCRRWVSLSAVSTRRSIRRCGSRWPGTRAAPCTACCRGCPSTPQTAPSTAGRST